MWDRTLGQEGKKRVSPHTATQQAFKTPTLALGRATNTTVPALKKLGLIIIQFYSTTYKKSHMDTVLPLCLI